MHLVAVGKTHPAEAIEAALAAGQRVFGENRVQEAAAKFPALRARYPDLRLHLIGPLQTNKIKQAVEAVRRDRDGRSRQAGARPGRGTGEERQAPRPLHPGEYRRRSSRRPASCRATPTISSAAAATSYQLPIVGLMCIPPADEHPAPHFALLGEIAKRHGLAQLSMGMSGDYELAIQMGATHVRVGTAIFGVRETKA